MRDQVLYCRLLHLNKQNIKSFQGAAIRDFTHWTDTEEVGMLGKNVSTVVEEKCLEMCKLYSKKNSQKFPHNVIQFAVSWPQWESSLFVHVFCSHYPNEE